MPFGWTRGADDDEDPEAARNRMVDRLASRIDRDATEAAMRAIPRHEFVPPDRRGSAYADRPLPIGNGQTISAPHMVAIMTDVLAPAPGERILEIGTGCGYHAAVTAEVVGAENVYSVEYHGDLAEDARRVLEDIGYGEASVRIGDGREGWPKHAPYDAVYLTCAPADFPDRLVEQVKEGGRILGPLGTGRQRLVLGRKQDDGLTTERHGGVRFVPMQ